MSSDHVQITEWGGYLWATSSKVFGLNVVAKDEKQLRERVITATQWLSIQNQQLEAK